MKTPGSCLKLGKDIVSSSWGVSIKWTVFHPMTQQVLKATSSPDPHTKLSHFVFCSALLKTLSSRKPFKLATRTKEPSFPPVRAHSHTHMHTYTLCRKVGAKRGPDDFLEFPANAEQLFFCSARC